MCFWYDHCMHARLFITSIDLHVPFICNHIFSILCKIIIIDIEERLGENIGEENFALADLI